MSEIDGEGVVSFVKSLQSPDGSFSGDSWGETDTRFTYCAINCLRLLNRIDAIDLGAAVEFIRSCGNFDGGFGSVPGAESHAGQVFCCVGALAMAGCLDRNPPTHQQKQSTPTSTATTTSSSSTEESLREKALADENYFVNSDLLSWWLCERQLPCGGLNGRPEKKEDVCYSWWVLSSLSILGRLHWIDRDALVRFIADCQDEHKGGFSDRPGDAVDVFHTFFGLAGLAMMGWPGLERIDPVYALPVKTVERMGLPTHFFPYDPLHQ